MGYEKRQIYLDKELDIEAYWFYGIMQKFPNHFHEYYVIGFVEEGQRRLLCKNKDYTINPQDLVILKLSIHRDLIWLELNIKISLMNGLIRQMLLFL